jgi:hypothetical protein
MSLEAMKFWDKLGVLSSARLSACMRALGGSGSWVRGRSEGHGRRGGKNADGHCMNGNKGRRTHAKKSGICSLKATTLPPWKVFVTPITIDAQLGEPCMH